MKSILYVGATLMIGASIYGFVDYKKTSHRNEFKKMYESNEVNVTEPVKSTTVTQPAEVTTVSSTKTSVVNTDPLSKEAGITSVAATTSTKKVKVAKKRKLNYKLFSRAPLREEIEVKELKTEPLKEVNLKTDNKENKDQ